MLQLTVDILKQSKQYGSYSYAGNAIEHWICAKTLQDLGHSVYRTAVIEGYAMAILQFTNHILVHAGVTIATTSRLGRLWELLCESPLEGIEKYKKLLQQFDFYYNKVCHEYSGPEVRQWVFDYLTGDSAIEQADNLLSDLYALSALVDSYASSDGSESTHCIRLNLFN